MTEPKTMESHFHARGRPNTPFYVVSQVQSCNMSPLGLLGFGLTTALLQGASTTITEAQTTNITFCFAMGYGGIAQLLAGMWEARRGKMFGAVVFSSYGAFWISYGLFGILATAGVIQGLTSPEGLQMMLSLWGIVTFVFFICALGLNLCLQLLLLLLTVTFFLLAAGEKHPTAEKVGGWFGIVTAAVAVYIGLAELFNEVQQRNILPLFPMNWFAFLAPKQTYGGRKPLPYDVNRTEARTFGPNQRQLDYDDAPATRPAAGTGVGGVPGGMPGDNNV